MDSFSGTLAQRVAHSTNPHGSESIREMIQQRLLLLGKVSFGLSFGFLAIKMLGVVALDGVGEVIPELALPRTYMQVAGIVFSLLLWMAMSVRVHSASALLWIDAISMAGACAAYAAMAMAGAGGMESILLGVLMSVLTLAIRALIVPSNALRTFGISTFAALLIFGVSYWMQAMALFDPRAHTVEDLLWNLAGWLVITVALSTFTSWLLFGLREQLQEAQRLGPYALGKPLGSGGMGVVYRATHAMLRRPTAVKLLKPEQQGAIALARFEREVQMTASLSHPNTITIFDYGRTPEGVFYYAMEFLDGMDLDKMVERTGPLPIDRVVHILLQVTSALVEAHGIGLVHRDIKPANIMVLGRTGTYDVAKLLDFGLVSDKRSQTDHRITADNVLLGTPLYMAPESVVDVTDIGPEADIYALGAVAYYLVTGEDVFMGETFMAVCAQHLNTPPEPPSRRTTRAIPPAFESLILHCLAKYPEDRPRTASEFRDLLLDCAGIEEWTPAQAETWWQSNKALLESLTEADPASDDSVSLGFGETVQIDRRKP